MDLVNFEQWAKDCCTGKITAKNGRYLTNFEQIYRYLIKREIQQDTSQKIVRCITQEAKQTQFSTRLEKKKQQQ